MVKVSSILEGLAMGHNVPSMPIPCGTLERRAEEGRTQCPIYAYLAVHWRGGKRRGGH